MFNIPTKTISEVADAVEIAKRLRVKVDWIDGIFEEIEKKKKKKKFALA